MPRVVEGIRFKPVYNWDEYFDGRQWEFTEEEVGDPVKFQRVVSSAASRKGVKVQTIVQPGKVYVQANAQSKRFRNPGRVVTGVDFKGVDYPDDWLNGQQWEVRQGEHFKEDPKIFTASLRNWVRRKKKKFLSQISGTTVYFQAYDE